MFPPLPRRRRSWIPLYGTGYIPTNATGAQNPTYGDPVTGGKPPYYENWNLGIQRALTGTMTLGVASKTN